MKEWGVMKYHNKALEDSRLHIRAEIKDAKKTHRLQLITERLNDSSWIQEALLPQDALSVEILSTAAQREEEVVPQIHNRSK